MGCQSSKSETSDPVHQAGPTILEAAGQGAPNASEMKLAEKEPGAARNADTDRTVGTDNLEPNNPSKTSGTYTVHLKRDAGVSVGLDLDLLDSIMPLITEVKDNSAVSIWNKNASPDSVVEVGDRIVCVSGTNGFAKDIAKEIADNTDINLVLHRSRGTEFEVAIKKKTETPLGLDLDFVQTSTNLLIRKISDGSPADMWNQGEGNTVGKKIRQKDRIIAVNGTKGKPQALLDMIKNSTELTLTILPFC